MKRTAAAQGEHNDEILRSLGYGEVDIASLRTDKVI
jgi:crotonobetainyl-CoA:carnitine CoA-transferase CaiB-like acyl-CoA transferase